MDDLFEEVYIAPFRNGIKEISADKLATPLHHRINVLISCVDHVR